MEDRRVSVKEAILEVSLLCSDPDQPYICYVLELQPLHLPPRIHSQ